MPNTGSDVTLNENGSVRVVFSCDDQFVTFQFFLGAEKAGDPQRLSRAEAAKIVKPGVHFDLETVRRSADYGLCIHCDFYKC